MKPDIEKIEASILKVLKHYGTKGVMQKEFVKEISLSKITISKYLNGLQRQGKINVREIGNYRIYYDKAIEV